MFYIEYTGSDLGADGSKVLTADPDAEEDQGYAKLSCMGFSFSIPNYKSSSIFLIMYQGEAQSREHGSGGDFTKLFQTFEEAFAQFGKKKSQKMF